MAVSSASALLGRILATDPGVDSDYRHHPKRVTPGEPLELPGALLKWYDLHADALPVTRSIQQLARTHLSTKPPGARGLGFVLLHRCGQDFHFLIVCTWRGSNEVWETVFFKNGDAMADFALFPRELDHKPTFCVWELSPVWHEKQAWTRFLESARNEPSGEIWLRDLFSGVD